MMEINISDVFNIIHDHFKSNNIFINDVNDNLMDLGMDSIQFIKMIIVIEETFGCEIPDEELFLSNMSTVSKIYQVLKNI